MARAVNPPPTDEEFWVDRLELEKKRIENSEAVRSADRARIIEEAAARRGVEEATDRESLFDLIRGDRAIINEAIDFISLFAIQLLSKLSGLPLDTSEIADTVLSKSSSLERDRLGRVLAPILDEIFDTEKAAADHKVRTGTGGSRENLKQFFGLNLRVALGQAVFKLLPKAIGEYTIPDIHTMGEDVLKAIALEDAAEELYEALIEATIKLGMEKEMMRKIKPVDLTVPEALQARIEGRITADELKQILDNAGVRDDVRDIMLARAAKNLTVSDLQELWDHNLLQPEGLDKALQEMTYDEDGRYVKTQLIINDRKWKLQDEYARCLRASFRAGAITESELRQKLGEMDWRASDVDWVVRVEQCKLGDARRSFLSDSDLDFAIDAGCLSVRTALDYLMMTGMTRPDAALAVAKMVYKSPGGKRDQFDARDRKVEQLRELASAAVPGPGEEAMRGISGAEVQSVIECLIAELQQLMPPEEKEKEPRLPRVVRFSVTPRQPVEGTEYVIEWVVERAERVTITPDIGDVAPVGSLVRVADDTTTFTLRATNDEGTTERQTSLLVRPKPEKKPKEPDLPVFRKFSVSPGRITLGDQVAVEWQVENADTVVLTPPSTAVPASGVRFDTPLANTIYSIVATNKDGSTSRNESVIVRLPEVPGERPKEPPVIRTFSLSPSRLSAPGPVELRWRVDKAERVTITPGVGTVPAEGSSVLFVDTTTTFRFEAENEDGKVIRHDTVVVLLTKEEAEAGPPPPVIRQFSISPRELTEPGAVTISWDVIDADTVEIRPDVGSVPPSGSLSVNVSTSTTFQLIARSGGALTSAFETVILTSSP